MKSFLLVVLFCVAALLPVTRAQAGIPTLNGTCPGGLEIHADNGGPVYVNGHETRLKRFNDNYVEATDSLSGVTLSISNSADGRAQVSYTGRGGANGMCSVTGASPAVVRSTGPHGSGNGNEVTCESNGRSQSECEMDTAGDVRLVRQLSKAPCVQGENWGLHRHSVWVNNGCRAVFRNDSHHNDVSTDPPVTPAAAGNLLGACNVRANAHGALVTRVALNDDVTELILDYPAGRFLCMVRNDGLVESLKQIKARN